VPLVVCQFEALSVTDDGPLAAKRAEPREQLQRDLGHPGSVSSVSSSATKRITAGVKAAEHSRNRIAWGLTLLVSKRRTKKNTPFRPSRYKPIPQIRRLAGIFVDNAQ
jgi:hypothetical protein